MKVLEGKLVAGKGKFAIVGARFNEFIVSKLISGAEDTLVRHGVDTDGITLVWVPGAFEIPIAAQKLAQSGKYDAVICLGAVIRGSTSHYELVCSETAKGIAQVGLQTGVPVTFGVITTENIEQAIERAGTKAGNKGADAAMRIRERIEKKRERKAVIPKKDYSSRKIIDTSDEKFQNSPGLQQWAAIENLKIAAQSYNEAGSLSDLEHKITVKTEAGKSAKQSVVELEHRMKDLAEIIKYAEQYKDNRSYHIAYKKAKNPDAYFRRYESQIILYGGARRMLEQAGIKLKGLNVDKLRAEYQALETQKKELTATYKSCEKEVWDLKRKQENLNRYLGRTQTDPVQEQQTKSKSHSL